MTYSTGRACESRKIKRFVQTTKLSGPDSDNGSRLNVCVCVCVCVCGRVYIQILRREQKLEIGPDNFVVYIYIYIYICYSRYSHYSHYSRYSRYSRYQSTQPPQPTIYIYIYIYWGASQNQS